MISKASKIFNETVISMNDLMKNMTKNLNDIYSETIGNFEKEELTNLED